jgi:hypothetical protein
MIRLNEQHRMKAKSPDDMMIWPDRTMATREEIDRGDYHFMSDDYRLATDEEIKAMEQQE